MGEIAIPYVFAALIAIELGYNTVRRTGFGQLRDSAASLLVAIPHFALLTIVPVAWFVVYRELEPRIPGALPADAWWIWPLGIVAMDFAAYWMHRYHHALNVTWAVHSVHHSSEHMTVTTGARSSVAEPFVNIVSGAYLILIAPALLGLPVAAAGVGWLVKDTWGFAVHTRTIDKLGVLEYVLATPSHHRVHHATNPIYLGKNFGFVFIVWDKLFGTFQCELREVEPIYGTTRPPASFHPMVIAFHGLLLVARDALAARRWRDKLRIWYMPAGWRPDELGAVARGPAIAGPDAPLSAVEGLQLALVLACVCHLALTVHTHGVAFDLAYLGYIVLGTAVVGAAFERSRHGFVLECARALVGLLIVVRTGSWFGRPFDGASTVVLVLAIAAVGASLGHDRADTRAGRRTPRRHAPRVRRVLVRLLPGGTAADRSDARRAPTGAPHPDRGRQG